LGNIWRFPFIAGQNGGGAFVLLYVGFVLLLGIPIITAELAMGRRGHQSPVVTMANLAREANSSQGWSRLFQVSRHPYSIRCVMETD
jgi:NSS family neurotransmitter:Na+ symporter